MGREAMNIREKALLNNNNVDYYHKSENYDYLYNKTVKLNYIIPMHKSRSQNIDIGIVYNKEFGYKGVVVKDNVVNIFPVEKIISCFNKNDSGVYLVNRLKNSPSGTWDFVYDEKRQTIIVWPHLRAAGKLGEFTTIGVTSSDSNTHSQVQNAFNNLVKSNNGAQVMNSFSGRITAYKLDSPLTVYRTIGSTGNPDLKRPGNYWTTTPPTRTLSHTLDSAMHPRLYGNDSNKGNYNSDLTPKQ